jgi:methionyl-tRNA formyltransferase
MKKLTLAYFGSPDFSADFLEKLINDPSINQLIDIKLVVTQPDRPVGRKQTLTPTPVKNIAIKNNVPLAEYVASEVTLREADSANWRRASQERRDHERQNLLQSIDLALVFAFSQKIPQDLLALPRLGFWNIHPSLLPKYRGPSPIAYPLIFGEKETGVTIIKMDDQIDHGPIIAQEKLKIEDNDRRPDLEKKLTDLGFLMFKKLILTNFNASTSLSINQFQLTPQANQNATYTKKLTKADGFIPLSTLKKALNNEPLKSEELPEILKIKNLKLKIKNSSKIVYDYFRGLYPWPGIWTLLPNGKRLKIIDMNLNITYYTLQVTRVQLEGKKETDFKTFQNAYQFF